MQADLPINGSLRHCKIYVLDTTRYFGKADLVSALDTEIVSISGALFRSDDARCGQAYM